MNPPQSMALSATIQHNADRLLALFESERNNAIADIRNQLIDLEQRLNEFHNRLATESASSVGVLHELAFLQDRFTHFRNSSGILTADAIRIRDLEATVAQLQARDLANPSTAIRDAAMAQQQEARIRHAFLHLRNRLQHIGILQKDDGNLSFSSDWTVILEELKDLASHMPGQANIQSTLARLATRLRSDRESQRARASNKSGPNKPMEIIDLEDDDPLDDSSTHKATTL
ncbi:hypothetical protein AX17_002852 [Amanita inopinata Kibby_2008]|nr:hypothetical protein AX17_002852 [Amanita inopinata Kibby_2008]